jgi:hypothetical protein
MKNLFKLCLVALVAFASCDKVDDLPVYGAGNAPVLTASATSIAPLAADSNNTVLTLNWTYPNHATDTQYIKYVVEIDSATKNFANPYRRTITDSMSTGFIAKDLNSFLLGRGYSFNVPVSMELRVISSYANNNERLISNVLAISMTPYKVPPKVPLPTTGKLFIVGGATMGGWTNPVPTPTQELARLDETTWGGVFEFTGGGQYLLLPENGQWGKYSVANNTLPGLESGGDFGQELADNFPAPAAAGWYKVIVDFQTGKFKVTPYTSVLPTNLFLVGDATPGGWNNPVPVPAQQMTRLNSSQWRITLNFTGSGKYLLLPVNGSWSTKYAVPDNTITDLWKGGELIYNSGQDIPGPNTAGNKTLLVDFATKENYATGKFTVTP